MVVPPHVILSKKVYPTALVSRNIKKLMELLSSVDPEMFGRARSLRRNIRTLANALVATGTLSREAVWPLELGALLAQMQHCAGRYDPQILDVARLCLTEEEAASPEITSTAIPLKSLAPRHVLAADILTCEGKFLLTAERRMTGVLLEKIRNYAAVVSMQEPISVHQARPSGSYPQNCRENG